MKKSDCKEALEIYKRFLTRVTKIGEFMKLAETIGVEKNDIPDINYAPSSILESLETHMNGLEDVKGGKKGSLLDLDPLSSSGPSGPSAAPTSWGDLLGSEMGDSLLSEPTLTAEAAPSSAAATPTPAAAEPGVSLAPPTSTAAATTPGAANMDLLGDAFSTPVPAAEASAAAAEGGAAAAAAAAPAPAANAGAVFDGLGDVMKPTLTPQAGDVDTSMANMASNRTHGCSSFYGDSPQLQHGKIQQSSNGLAGAPGAPMMQMARPSFPSTGATPGAPMSPGAGQSPRKPQPPRNALDDLNIKDFM
ncbi:Clathrin coat assembly protein AP180 [Liparis tanakae]|uniref:Clathrin coat assembly protein AP180 n=1 Tax=Liparis tanakae TaxID=230148 RepID=A0A4Z2G4E5_9TELE|nr:Clathrin coat assembly protein AP180 [Liparis tanakae]